MTAFVAKEPCETCPDDRQFTVPEQVCADGECEFMAALARVMGRAAQAASAISHEPDQRLRAEEASASADGYASVLWTMDATLDEAAYLRACNVPADCTRCRTRKPADGWIGKCAACEEAA